MKNKGQKSHKSIWSLIIILLLMFFGTLIFDSRSTSTTEAYNFGMHQFYDGATPLDPEDITNYTVSPDGTRAASILIQNFGGSGTFYYLVGGMNNGSSTIYSEPESLGDRIIVNSVDVTNPSQSDNGLIIVDYLDRAPTEAMAEPPTVETKVTYEFEEDGNLIETSN